MGHRQGVRQGHRPVHDRATARAFYRDVRAQNRVGKIFIDYLRNARGASTVAAYSVRARPGLPVSVPISREELKGLRSAQQWTVANVQQRLNGLKADPWAGYTNRQKLSQKMWDKLGARPPV